MTSETDSTIAPPPSDSAVCFYERFMAARREEGCHENHIFMCLLVCKRLSGDDFGVARGTVFQEIRAGVGFKTGDFVQEVLEGLP